MALPNLLTKLFAAITQMEGAVNTANNANATAVEASQAASSAETRIDALEDAAVHKAGTETITGIKTWQGDSVGPRATNADNLRNITLEASAAKNFGLYYRATDLTGKNKWLVFCDDQGDGHLNGTATNATKDVNNKAITSYAADIAINGKNISLRDGTGALIKSITTQDTTYAVMQGATGNADGVAGLVPKPVIANREMYLGGDAKWHGTFTKNAPGLVPSSGGGTTKFLRADGTWVATPDTVYSHPTYTARTGQPTADVAPAFGGAFNVTQPVCDKWGHITGLTSRKITIPKTAATASAAGLVSTGEQIFAGAKTFSSAVTVQNNANTGFIKKESSYTRGSSTSSNARIGGIWHQDKDGKTLGCLYNSVSSEDYPYWSWRAYWRSADTVFYQIRFWAGESTASFGPYTTSGDRSDGGSHNINLGRNATEGRWQNEYFATAPNVSSDERLKTAMGVIPDSVLDAWENVRWRQFKFRDAVDEKGDGARVHTGLIAQQVDSAFSGKGQDAAKYGLFCKSEDDGYYSIRYEEALCMEAAYQRRRADRLEARLAKLEAKVFADN